MSATKPEIGSSLARVEPASVAVDYSRELEGAKALFKSGLLPQGVKSPEAAMFIVLTGRDLGLSPVQSLRSIHVIQGKIEVAADMQLGLFHRARGQSKWITLTNEAAVLMLSAPWLLEPHTETFTMADAKQAKLGGDNWQKYPKAMLRSRAITAGLKSIGFDPTAGMYSPGEIGGPETAEAVIQAEEEGIARAFGPAPIGAPDGGQCIAPGEAEPDDAAGSAALAEIEAALPSLPGKQEQYIREQLRNGAEPVALLEFLQEKGVLPKAAV